MKAMTTRYRPATAHQGSRMLASDGDNNRVLKGMLK